MDSITWILLGSAAFFTSMVSATLGMAGGVTLLAVMAALMAPAVVVPLHGAVQLAANFTRLLVFIKQVRWSIFFRYCPGVTVGMALAAALWSGDKLHWFRPVIGLFIVLFLASRSRKPRLRTLPLWTFVPVGLVGGFLNLFVGVVGPFMAPFLLRDDLKKEEVIATGAVCQFYGHLLKLPAFLVLGFDYGPHLGVLVLLVTAVVLGTLLGKRVLGRLPQRAFLMGFQGVLAIVALYLIAQAFS